MHAGVLLADDLGACERLAGAPDVRLGQAGVERERHRHLEDPDRLDRDGVDRGLVGGLAGDEQGGGLHDVVVERAAVQGHEDRAVVAFAGLLGAQHLGRHGDAPQRRALVEAAVDEVEHEAGGHPAEPDVAGGVVDDASARPSPAAESSAPSTASSGSSPPRKRTERGVRKGRRRSGSR